MAMQQRDRGDWGNMTAVVEELEQAVLRVRYIFPSSIPSFSLSLVARWIMIMTVDDSHFTMARST